MIFEAYFVISDCTDKSYSVFYLAIINDRLSFLLAWLNAACLFYAQNVQ